MIAKAFSAGFQRIAQLARPRQVQSSRRSGLGGIRLRSQRRVLVRATVADHGDLARAAVGRRWPSVFKMPVREALQAPDHPSAIAINHRLAGAGVSAQAFALRTKLLQVDAWVRHAELRVVEVHPEVSFAALAGVALSDPKTTSAGATHRRRLLAEAGIEIPDDLGPAGSGAAVGDVLDAAAAAWTARRVAHGQASSMPNRPEVFSDGLPAAIWA